MTEKTLMEKWKKEFGTDWGAFVTYQTDAEPKTEDMKDVIKSIKKDLSSIDLEEVKKGALEKMFGEEQPFKISHMEVVKKEYVFTIKENGKLRKIKKPIKMFSSHRNCIINEDGTIDRAIDLALKKLVERILK